MNALDLYRHITKELTSEMEKKALRNGEGKHSLEMYRYEAGRVQGIKDSIKILEASYKHFLGENNS
ncbi:MAG: hypothetical protein ACXWYM_00365 [Candidatus Binatia bacterium]